MRKHLSWGIAISLLCVTPIWSARAIEPIVSEAGCRLEGYTRPLRQTIVVIDQAAIDSSSTDPNGVNRKWINAVLEFAGVQEAQSNVISAPRERITVLLALQDGSDLVRVFAGCPSTFSPSEFAEKEKQSSGIWSGLETFTGRDARSRAEADKKTFRVALLGALVQLQRSYSKTKGGADDGSFLDAFPAISRAFDVANGIPRLILITPLESRAVLRLQSVKDARESGFDIAAKTDADLQRSEVYITSISKQSGKYLREFMQTFLLGIKGRLVVATSESIPAFADAPQIVQVFGGSTDYGGVKAPIQLRLAIDRTGSLVNSWVEVSLHKPLATPLTGKAVCKTESMESCEVKGDGKEFSQSWVIEPGPAPKFDPTLPFSGLRYFEFTSAAAGVKGRFYDPVVIINGQKELPFELAKTAGVKF
jgi:hypothetical protein